jgi:hypothetical protein
MMARCRRNMLWLNGFYNIIVVRMTEQNVVSTAMWDNVMNVSVQDSVNVWRSCCSGAKGTFPVLFLILLQPRTQDWWGEDFSRAVPRSFFCQHDNCASTLGSQKQAKGDKTRRYGNWG